MNNWVSKCFCKVNVVDPSSFPLHVPSISGGLWNWPKTHVS